MLFDDTVIYNNHLLIGDSDKVYFVDLTDLEIIQNKFDEMTLSINDLQAEFEENESELETVARESIAETIEYILQWFDIGIDVEDALGERDW